jgi:hypothetical protein
VDAVVIYAPMPDHNYFANLIWQIADLLRGPYRPPQYERVMLPMTVLRRFDCVLAGSKAKVLAEHAKLAGGKVEGDALDRRLNKVAGQRFHTRSRPAAEQGRWPTLPQPLAARLREAQGRPGQHREAPRQLHQRLLGERPPHLRLLRVRDGDRADA